MSKTNAKRTDLVQEDTAQEAGATTPAGADAVVSAAPPAEAARPATDAHHGHGGHYTVGEDGVRRLVERTAERTTPE